MTTDELKAAAELWRLGRETPTQERLERARRLVGAVGDYATERKFRQASNVPSDWAVERLATEQQQAERIATIERERDEARFMYLALYGRVGLVLTLIGEGDKFPDKPEWRKGDA